MNKYEGIERRNGYTELVTDVAVIKNDIKHLTEMIEAMPAHVSRYEFKSHVSQDRIFYVIITGLLFVLLKGVFF